MGISRLFTKRIKLNRVEKLTIATGLRATSKTWKNEETTWAELAAKLAVPVRTSETVAQYQAATRKERGQIKDVGGYVGGYLRGGTRKPQNVIYRSLVTLDLDYATEGVWDNLTLLYGCAAVLHSTHSHSEAQPKYRLVLPLNRNVGSDEYAAASRSIAGALGIDLFDPTGFQPYRLMFWPSCSSDASYYYREQKGEPLDVDAVLAGYIDWRDSALWPSASSEDTTVRGMAAKQQDPEQKKGVIGAFCRAYDIHEAIETFLPGKYTSAGDDRYTYADGSTAGGLVVYEDKWAYSHHGTDPTSGQLCNAFDLVRVHKFVHLDNTPNSKASTREMEAFAAKDAAVLRLIAAENLSAARYEFAEGYEPAPTSDADDMDWAEGLEVDTRGKYLSSAANLNAIFANDPNLKGRFRRNEFDNKRYLSASVPWRAISEPEPIRDVDYSGVRNYLDTVYSIVGSSKIDDAMALELQRQTFHPVREYLGAARKAWDGAHRVDTLLIEYFGAEDTIYTREAVRKMLVGAVARVRNPGVKFDLVLTLVGEQGVGKSTFIAKLGGAWFSDTFTTVSGKDSFEQLQGSWLIEIAELAGFRKHEADAVKHFITKTVDTFRPAYSRTVESFMRQCVFIGTTNNRDFLRDPTGARRFLPVDVVRPDIRKSVHDDLTPDEVVQIWGEAVAMYEAGEPLYMCGEGEVLARLEQHLHQEGDERSGLIAEYLDTLLPKNWDSLDPMERRMFLSNTDETPGTIRRQYVCVAEIWVECLWQERKDMRRTRTAGISDIMRALPEWEMCKNSKRFGHYGKQKYYQRKSA